MTNDLIVAKLMKQGRYDEVAALLSERKRMAAHQDTFVSFMDELIENSGLSRSKIVQRSGLSKDYMYKVLRGDKRTEERDYIIAFCLAAKTSLPQVQHALELYPFPILDEEDNRSYLIINAFLNEIDLDTLNETLYKVGFPMIKVSPEMPSAKVGPVRSTFLAQKPVKSPSDEGNKASSGRRFIKMKKHNTIVEAQQVGMAPMDLAVNAEFELENDKGEIVFAQAYFGPESSFFAIDRTSMYKEEYLEHSEQLEFYETLEEAGDSAYFMYFVELDKLTDQKAADELKHVDDTKYCENGLRFGMASNFGNPIIYGEWFNSSQPEKNEYLQIRKSKDGTIFSVSHTSYYMQYELGEIYEAYFPVPEKQLYLVEVTSIDDLGDYTHYVPVFRGMQSIIENNQL